MKETISAPAYISDYDSNEALQRAALEIPGTSPTFSVNGMYNGHVTRPSFLLSTFLDENHNYWVEMAAFGGAETHNMFAGHLKSRFMDEFAQYLKPTGKDFDRLVYEMAAYALELVDFKGETEDIWEAGLELRREHEAQYPNELASAA